MLIPSASLASDCVSFKSEGVIDVVKGSAYCPDAKVLGHMASDVIALELDVKTAGEKLKTYSLVGASAPPRTTMFHLAARAEPHASSKAMQQQPAKRTHCQI